jgi:hypothetical protein
MYLHGQFFPNSKKLAPYANSRQYIHEQPKLVVQSGDLVTID